MTKTAQLNDLFNTWENEYPKGTFCRDGIINEQLFSNAEKKVLYITKEPNDPTQKQWDYREWYNKEISSYPFCYRITEWAYGILKGFPPIEEVWKDPDMAHYCLRSIAMMNIKKLGGGGSPNYDEMMKYAENDIPYLRKEISIINPDIIILGIITWKKLRNHLFNKEDWSHSGYDIAIGRYHNAKVIDFYHPSSRNAPSAAYSLLQNIILSDKFKKL